MSSMNSNNPKPAIRRDISVVIPVYNNKETLENLHYRLDTVMKTLLKSYEVIFVNDGSTDGSCQALLTLFQQNKHIKLIDLTRNFGQNAAIAAGIEHAVGKIIVTMDADLQNYPEDIPRLIEEIEKGVDFVSGVRSRRKDAFFSRRVPSFFANKMIQTITGIRLRDYGCGINAVTSEVAREIAKQGEMRRFLKPVVAKVAPSVAEIEVRHSARIDKPSGYTFLNLVRLFMDMLILYPRPMRWVKGLGTMLFVFGLLLGAIHWALYLGFHIYIGDTIASLYVKLLVSGAVVFGLGLLARGIKKIYRRITPTPLYRVEKIYE